MTQEAEDKYKRMITTVLRPWFNIFPEVWGTDDLTGNRVRIDYVLTPKQALIDKGWTADAIGLSADGDDQANVYSQVTFKKHGKLRFVATYRSPKTDLGSAYAACVAIRALDGIMEKNQGHCR